MFWFYLFLIVVGDFFYLFCARKFADGDGKIWFATLIFISIFSGIFFCQLLQFRGLAIANILWAAFSIIFGALAGIFLFAEKITIAQFGGIFLILLGIIFLEFGAKN